jgi:type III secretory pathway component EscT
LVDGGVVLFPVVGESEASAESDLFPLVVIEVIVGIVVGTTYKVRV